MRILWIDDEELTIQATKQFLEDNGHVVDVVNNSLLAMNLINSINFDLVLMDVMMPDDSTLLTKSEIEGGKTTGIALARKLKKEHPALKIVGCSIVKDEKIINWFKDYCQGYISKGDIYINSRLLNKLQSIVSGLNQPNIFIVHGHDSDLLNELKSFLQNNLKLPEPLILREQPSLGKTIIEKFEHYSEETDIVFVLLTPDDLIQNNNKSDKRRARQNVLFELGYFYGKLQRNSGKIILISKGDIELPTDISGIIYLHTDNTIKSISEDIRNELKGIR